MFARALSLALCFALASAPVGVARAQAVQEIELPPSEQAARGHYLMGLDHYREARFDEAVREFTLAHELSGRPELLYNIHLAHRDAGRPGAAADALRAYLEAVPDANDAPLLRARLSALEAQARAQEAPATPTAERETVPAAAFSASESGASDSGASATNPVPWILVGTGAALLVGAGVTGGLAFGVHEGLQSDCPNYVCPPNIAYEERASDGRTLAITTDVLGAVGIATLGAGLVWAIVEFTSGGSSSEQAVQCGPGGCAVRF